MTRTRYWCGRESGGADTHSDVMVERFDDRVPGDFEPAAQIIPDRDAQFVTRLEETEESIAAVAADVAPCAGADLAPCDVTANVVLRTVGVERDLRPLQHHQQLILIGMQPRQQAVQRGEASAAKEDTVEACAQR